MRRSSASAPCDRSRPRGGVSHGGAQAAALERPVGGGGEQLQRDLGQVGRQPGDAAELLHQLGSAGGMMGEVVDADVLARHELGDARVAHGPSRLRERLVGGVAHRVAAELPTAAAHLQQAQLVELVDDGRGVGLTQRRGELLEAEHVARRAEHGSVLEHLALLEGELVEAGGDEGAQRIGQLAVAAGFGERDELDEEQRVAAAAVVQLGERGLGRLVVAEQLASQLVGLVAGERLQVERQHGGAVGARRPRHVAARSHRGDEHERQASQRRRPTSRAARAAPGRPSGGRRC